MTTLYTFHSSHLFKNDLKYCKSHTLVIFTHLKKRDIAESIVLFGNFWAVFPTTAMKSLKNSSFVHHIILKSKHLRRNMSIKKEKNKLLSVNIC